MNEWATRRAIEIEELRHTGRCMGLRDAETEEVITAWLVQAGIVDLNAVYDAVIRRAVGMEWRPDAPVTKLDEQVEHLHAAWREFITAITAELRKPQTLAELILIVIALTIVAAILK